MTKSITCHLMKHTCPAILLVSDSHQVSLTLKRVYHKEKGPRPGPFTDAESNIDVCLRLRHPGPLIIFALIVESSCRPADLQTQRPAPAYHCHLLVPCQSVPELRECPLMRHGLCFLVGHKLRTFRPRIGGQHYISNCISIHGCYSHLLIPYTEISC